MKVPGLRMSSDQKGQSMVEFALVLPTFLLVIWVVLEVAHLILALNIVAMASREAARYGAGMGGAFTNGTAYWQDCDGIRGAARRIGGFLGIQDSDIQIFRDNGPGTSPTQVCNPGALTQVANGDRISVRVVARFALLVPLMQLQPIPINSQSSHTILTGITVGQ